MNQNNIVKQIAISVVVSVIAGMILEKWRLSRGQIKQNS